MSSIKIRSFFGQECYCCWYPLIYIIFPLISITYFCLKQGHDEPTPGVSVNTHQNEAHIISEGGSRNAYITGNVTFVYMRSLSQCFVMHRGRLLILVWIVSTKRWSVYEPTQKESMNKVGFLVELPSTRQRSFLSQGPPVCAAAQKWPYWQGMSLSSIQLSVPYLVKLCYIN